MKIDSRVKRLDIKQLIDFHYKRFVHEGQMHLWFTMGERSHYYEPEFSMGEHGRWEHVASWPLEMPFTENAIEDILVEWFLWYRGRSWKMEMEKVAEIAYEHIWGEATGENREWDRQLKIKMEKMVNNFQHALMRKDRQIEEEDRQQAHRFYSALTA